MTCLDCFTGVGASLVKIRGLNPGVSFTFKQDSSHVQASVDGSFKNPAVEATVFLKPGCLTFSSCSDGKGGIKVDTVIIPNLNPFNAKLKIRPLRGNQFEFGLKHVSEAFGSVALDYVSEEQSTKVTVEPKHDFSGGAKIFGRVAFSGSGVLEGGSALVLPQKITLRSCYCPQEGEKPSTFRVAGFKSISHVTFGIGAGWKAIALPFEFSAFLKFVPIDHFTLSGIGKIATVDGKSSFELRGEKERCSCPKSSLGLAWGFVLKYADGKLNGGAGGKLSCEKCGASLGVSYTEEKSLIAVLTLPLPKCSNFRVRPTVSTTWKTLEFNSTLLRPSVGVSLVFDK